MTKYWIENRWLLLLFYVLVFFLLKEWMLPVMTLTDTDQLSLFLFFIGICFGLSLFSLKWWISGPIKLLYIGWVLLFIFTEEVFFTLEGISFLINDFVLNIFAIVSGNLSDVTNSFRTILFFALLWMTVYLIIHWISVRHNIFLFYILTVIFIAVLDTFSPYDGATAILRVMLIGLLLTGLLKLSQIMEQHQFKLPKPKLVWAFVPLAFLIGLSGVISYILPKAGPIWPDPVPFITSFAEGAGNGAGRGGGIGKIGYDEDDTRLGGSFIGDDTVVFEADVDRGQYWKIETKDVYTGKGWEQSAVEETTVNYFSGDTVDTGIIPGDLKDVDVAQLSMKVPYSFIMQPYGLMSVEVAESTVLSYQSDSQKLRTYEAGSESKLKKYGVIYSEPRYSLKALRETSTESLQSLPADMDRYLQLPENLPERVKELAFSITENQNSLHEKAQAIERYFARNGFVYDQTNIAIPTEDEDYVDQFLFGTKRGYCDNFSTSMVVMLRSIGIPAKWVKGFSEGQQIRNADNQSVYRVTNNNAHSWVEAYFPEVGWMPFEPTIGFSGAANLNFDLDLTAEANQPTTPEQPEKPETPEKDKENQSDDENSFTAIMKSTIDYLDHHKGRISIYLLVLLALFFGLFKIRSKWMPKLLVPMYRMKRGNWTSFEMGYHRLLKQLELHGIKREHGQTLKMYAENVDYYFETKDMRILTEAYEKGFYGGKIEEQQWRSLRESWENLIKRTSS